MTLLATAIAVPLGLLGGIYLAEFGQGSRLADNTRFSANVLIGMPSIIIGVFAYALVVIPLGKFSGYAGIVALAIIMLPITARTTEDMLHLVPNTCGKRPWPWGRRAGRSPCRSSSGRPRPG